MLARRGWLPHTETLVMTVAIDEALSRLASPAVIPGRAQREPGTQGSRAPSLDPWVPDRASGASGMTEILLEDSYTTRIDAIIRDTAASDEEYAERSAIAARTPRPRRFAMLQRDGATAAVGLTVVTGAWAAIFLMRTHPAHRRRGLARDILAALLGWARDQGASHAFLQVEAANASAIALYAGAAFESAYSYRYWRPEAEP